MAENSLSQAVSFINDNSTMEVGLTAEGQPAVRSDIVAYHFKRSHKNVLRDIAKLRAKCPESFHRLNFEPMFIETQIGNGATRKDRAYLLTRDGFSLLVMGFTGAEAVRWKLRYIEAFNSLEAAALEHWAELARESGYLQGLDAGRASAAPLLDEMRGKPPACSGDWGRRKSGVCAGSCVTTLWGFPSVKSAGCWIFPAAACRNCSRRRKLWGCRRKRPPAPYRATCWRWKHERH